ncbi:MAG: hypothetical protein KF878_37165, partial [Planctomycetes bacterium]|nr:hypothetical protein [Planctomycetota bacterium]
GRLDGDDAAAAERLLAAALALDPPPTVALALGAEAALSRGDLPGALGRAEAAIARGGGPAARWALGRSLLAADRLDEAEPHLRDAGVARLTQGLALRLLLLERARGDLAAAQEEHARHRRLEYESLTRARPELVARIARALREVAAQEPGPTLAALRAAERRLVARRLAADLLDVGGVLRRLLEPSSPLDAETLAGVLDAAAAALAGEPEATALEALRALAVLEEGMLRQAPDHAERQDRARRTYEEALARPLSERWRALVVALRHELLSNTERARDDELQLATAALALEVTLAPHDGMIGRVYAMRERVIDALLGRAWNEPAARADLVARVLALCEVRRADPTSLALPRRRMKALLLGGRPVEAADLEGLSGRDRDLFEAEVLLLTDPVAALDLYARLVRSQRERRPGDRFLREALGGWAAALALTAAPADAATAALDEAAALASTDNAWLPWRTPKAMAETLRAIRERGWRPRPDEAFPESAARPSR